MAEHELKSDLGNTSSAELITIDGPAGTGKSTIARGLARALGFVYFDTGAMYRALALHLTESGISLDDLDAIRKVLSDFEFNIVNTDSGPQFLLNGRDVSAGIRTPQISRAASVVACHREVREKLVDIQRGFARGKQAVYEGRDLGSVVFPDACLKIFLTADPLVRAQRRFQELQSKAPEINLTVEKVLQEQQQRDYEDQHRAVSPLIVPVGAQVVDTSTMTPDEIIQKLVELWHGAVLGSE